MSTAGVPESVRRHFEAPVNVGTLSSEAADVGTGVAGSAASGAMIKMQVQCRADATLRVRYKAFGCGWTIAAASLVSEHLSGRAWSRATADSGRLVRELELPEDKRHCAELAAAAAERALAELRRKLDAAPGRPVPEIKQSSE